MHSPFVSIQQAIKDIRQGKMLIVVDDSSRENEGDLIIASEHVNDEAVQFMLNHARGQICLSMEAADLDRLEVPLMKKSNTTRFTAAFTHSIEASHGVTTGISVKDRVHTIKVASDPNSKPSDISTPGHVFPLRAEKGGVLVRSGHTEATVDLVKLAGYHPAGILCEILNQDGSMARVPDLVKFSQKHQINMVNIEDLIKYRMQSECFVRDVATAKLPIKDLGEFEITIFENILDQSEHTVLTKGDIDLTKPVLVRVHSECLTGDAFNSSRCDCGWQLNAALKQIADEGGILIYMSQEGRGIGLANKIRAYHLQDQGMDTVEANQHLGFEPDHRDYGIGSQILRYLGVKKMRLMTNNPRKIHGIGGYDIDIVSVEPIITTPSKENKKYLQTKQAKLGHLLNLSD